MIFVRFLSAIVVHALLYSVEANAFSCCLKRWIAVDEILCNVCRLSIYRNNFDKNSDYETETDLSSSDATSEDPKFEVKVKWKEAVSETQ